MSHTQKPIALVTGGSRGIGFAIAQHLASLNFHVVLLSRNTESLENATQLIVNQGGVASFFACDVTLRENLELVSNKIFENFGVPHTIVNNAGLGGPFQRISSIESPQWGIVMRTNLESVFYLLKYFLPHMARVRFGRIINISSIMGTNGSSYSSAYVASKHAIIGLTKSVAAEWGPEGITCNSVSPGYIATEMLDGSDENGGPTMDKLLSNIPCRRFGAPNEVAKLVGYLTSAEASYINGSNIVIDGGYSAHFGYHT